MPRNSIKKKFDITAYKEERKSFFSECCKSSFISKSNGLWTYYVCEECLQKTLPVNNNGKMLDLHGAIKRRSKK